MVSVKNVYLRGMDNVYVPINPSVSSIQHQLLDSSVVSYLPIHSIVPSSDIVNRNKRPAAVAKGRFAGLATSPSRRTNSRQHHLAAHPWRVANEQNQEWSLGQSCCTERDDQPRRHGPACHYRSVQPHHILPHHGSMATLRIRDSMDFQGGSSHPVPVLEPSHWVLADMSIWAV